MSPRNCHPISGETGKHNAKVSKKILDFLESLL
jgi:hypothetical protein